MAEVLDVTQLYKHFVSEEIHVQVLLHAHPCGARAQDTTT